MQYFLEACSQERPSASTTDYGNGIRNVKRGTKAKVVAPAYLRRHFVRREFIRVPGTRARC